MPCGGRTASERYQPGFCRSIQAGRTGGPLLFLPVEGGLKPLFDQTLSDPKHGIHTDGEALGDLCIRPGRPIRIGFYKDMSMSDLVGRCFPFSGQLCQLVAFLIRKPHDVLLVHGTLRLLTRYTLRRNSNRLTSKNEADKVLVAGAKFRRATTTFAESQRVKKPRIVSRTSHA